MIKNLKAIGPEAKNHVLLMSMKNQRKLKKLRSLKISLIKISNQSVKKTIMDSRGRCKTP